MNNPHFINFRAWPDYSERDSAELILSRTGGNTGNLLFVSTVHRVVKHTQFSTSMRFDHRKIREHHDGLIIPAANWLNSNSDWGNLARLIEASKMPCVMIGLGAQSPSADRIPKVSNGTLRLLKVVSERSHSISVRGNFSAEVLAHYGITNITVTGCPSLLWHVGQPAHVSPSTSIGNLVSICSTRENTLASLSDRGIRSQAIMHLTRLARRHGYDFVAQTERHDIDVSRGTFTDVNSEKEALSYVMSAYGEPDKQKIKAYLAVHLKVFCSVPDWLRYLEGRHFVMGTRLHGVIAGLLAGIPGALVLHDARTQEIADFLSIPSITAEHAMAAGNNLSEIYAAIDLKTFNTRMVTYFSQFQSFFAANQVEVNLPPLSKGAPGSST